MVSCAAGGTGASPAASCALSRRFGVLVFGQHLARPPYHFIGKAGQLRHFDAVTAVGRARFDLAQKNDPASRLLRRHVVVLHPRKLFGKFGQLEVVGGEERLRPGAGVQVFDRRPGDGQAVIGRGAAPDFVEQDQRFRR